MSLSPAAATALKNTQVHLDRGEFGPALGEAETAIQLAPEHPDGYFLKGRVLTEMRRYEEAAEAYLNVLDRDPDYLGARFNLGNVALRHRDWEGAISWYRQARVSHLDAQVRMARAHLALHQPDEARRLLQGVLEADSTHAEALARLGTLIAEEGSTDVAIQFFRRAVRSAPEDSDYRYLLGEQLYRSGRLQPALEQLNEVLRRKPYHRGALYNLTLVYQRLEMADEAAAMHERSERANDIHHALLNQESMASTYPTDPTVWFRLGDLHRQIGNLEDGIHAYNVALALDPGDAMLRANVAGLHLLRGDTLEAARRFQALLDDDPTLVHVRYNLGVIYEAQEKNRDALEQFKEVLRLMPSHENARKRLARLSDR